MEVNVGKVVACVLTRLFLEVPTRSYFEPYELGMETWYNEIKFLQRQHSVYLNNK